MLLLLHLIIRSNYCIAEIGTPSNQLRNCVHHATVGRYVLVILIGEAIPNSIAVDPSSIEGDLDLLEVPVGLKSATPIRFVVIRVYHADYCSCREIPRNPRRLSFPSSTSPRSGTAPDRFFPVYSSARIVDSTIHWTHPPWRVWVGITRFSCSRGITGCPAIYSISEQPPWLSYP